tara:strand:+ start:580 stop:1149 length:570 start_codon:yes stop_codon:yes gene_type:complete
MFLKVLKLMATNPSLLAKKVYGRMHKLYKLYIQRDPFTIEVTRWFKDDGDATLRLDYDLNDSSVVFDLGGYKGNFARDIHERYGCHVFVFEPEPKFFKECKTRFGENNKVQVFNIGLSNEDGEFLLSDSDDGSSFLAERNARKGQLCQVRKFHNVLSELDIKEINLMKINIEGSEYPLMDHILEENLRD